MIIVNLSWQELTSSLISYCIYVIRLYNFLNTSQNKIYYYYYYFVYKNVVTVEKNEENTFGQLNQEYSSAGMYTIFYGLQAHPCDCYTYM